MEFTYPPVEDPDWDYARTRFTAVRSPRSTWSQSVLSTDVDGYMVPNRDYPYQGLTTIVDGDLWKVLDGVGVAVERGGDRMVLEPDTVSARPAETVYRYQGEDATVTVTYRTGDRAAAVTVDIDGPDDTTVRAAPLVDLRRMPDGDSEVSVTEQDGYMSVDRDGMRAVIGPGCRTPTTTGIGWTYKLDSGDRVDDGAVRFDTATGQPLLVERLTAHDTPFTIGIAFGPDATVEQAAAARHRDFTAAGEHLRFETGDDRLDRFLAMRARTLDT
ncbi:MAG: hypothetical protein ABEK12_03100, partial [Candidatus Nanohaloarchaea archaeon]